MRHRKKGRKFHRMTGERKSFMQGLVSNLIMKGKIETTEARAKEVRPAVEKLVTLAKRQDLHSLRLLLSRIPKQSAQKLYYELANKYQDRKGGYTRIVKTAKTKKRDASRIARIEFV